MVFSSLTLGDIEIVRRYGRFNRCGSCELSCGCLMMWRDYYSIEFCEHGGVLYTLQHDTDGSVYFNLPLCSDELLPEALLAVKQHCDEQGVPCRFCTVPEHYLPLLRSVLGDILPENNRDYSDYIYNAVDIIGLIGKKYANQRNHISRFKRCYPDWSFEPIGEGNLAEVRAFMGDFCARYHKQSQSSDEDMRMTADLLDNYAQYGMLGGLLRVNGRVVGFSAGEVVGDTLIVHTEKADRDFDGAYQMLTNCFAAAYAGDAAFINREDDMGDEGLRRAKLAYHPTRMIDKYTVTVKKSC